MDAGSSPKKEEPREEGAEAQTAEPAEDSGPSQVAGHDAADENVAADMDEIDFEEEDEALERPLPTALEIAEFARYLGMDPVTDCHLLWIAEEALAAPLSDEWEEHVDEDNQVYYYNVETDVSQREHPLDEHYRQLYLHMKQQEEEQAASGAPAPDGPVGKEEPAGATAASEAAAAGGGVRRRAKPAEARSAAAEAATSSQSSEGKGAEKEKSGEGREVEGAGGEEERGSLLSRAATVAADGGSLAYLAFYATQRPTQYMVIVLLVWLYLFVRVTRVLLGALGRRLFSPAPPAEPAPKPKAA